MNLHPTALADLPALIVRRCEARRGPAAFFFAGAIARGSGRTATDCGLRRARSSAAHGPVSASNWLRLRRAEHIAVERTGSAVLWRRVQLDHSARRAEYICVTGAGTGPSAGQSDASEQRNNASNSAGDAKPTRVFTVNGPSPRRAARRGWRQCAAARAAARRRRHCDRRWARDSRGSGQSRRREICSSFAVRTSAGHVVCR